MGSAVSSFIRRLIDEEIRRVVADAIEDGVILWLPPRPPQSCGVIRTAA